MTYAIEYLDHNGVWRYRKTDSFNVAWALFKTHRTVDLMLFKIYEGYYFIARKNPHVG